MNIERLPDVLPGNPGESDIAFGRIEFKDRTEAYDFAITSYPILSAAGRSMRKDVKRAVENPDGTIIHALPVDDIQMALPRLDRAVDSAIRSGSPVCAESYRQMLNVLLDFLVEVV